MCHSTFFISTSPFSTLVGTSFAALLCVLWWGALDRLWLRAAQFVRVCSTTGYIPTGLRGPTPQALTLFRGVGFIARRLRECRQGPRHFWNCLSRWASALRQGPTLKTALCHIRTLVGRRINIGTFFAELIRGKESYVIRGCIRLTASSSGRFNNLFFFTVLFKGYERSLSAGRNISGGHNRPVEIDSQDANTKRTH